jgi:hypothetical protein
LGLLVLLPGTLVKFWGLIEEVVVEIHLAKICWVGPTLLPTFCPGVVESRLAAVGQPRWMQPEGDSIEGESLESASKENASKGAASKEKTSKEASSEEATSNEKTSGCSCRQVLDA